MSCPARSGPTWPELPGGITWIRHSFNFFTQLQMHSQEMVVSAIAGRHSTSSQQARFLWGLWHKSS